MQSDIYANAYSYLMIIFLGLPVHPALQLPFQHPAGSRRQPDSFPVSGILRCPEYFPGSVFHSRCRLGMCRCCICNHCRSGDQRNPVPHRDHPADGSFMAVQRKPRCTAVIPLRNCSQMGLPTGLQFSITAIGSMVMQSANNGLGGDYVCSFYSRRQS